MTIPRMGASRRSLLLGAAGAGLALPFAARAQQYRAEYKLSVVGNRPIPFADGAFRWAELVTERSGGRINVKVYPGSQLVGGDQTRELVAMRQGVIDFAVFSTINIAPQVREVGLFQLPFLMPDHRAFDALIRGDVGRDIFGVMERRDVVPLAWGENGFREISNSKRPIRTPADLKGLKIRVVGSPLYLDTFTALGANPTQMSWADAQPALSTGAVDGQENPVAVFTAAKLSTLGQKHLTLWGYVADPLIFVVNKEVWNGWSKEDQEAVRAAAVQAAAEEVAIARKGITAQDDSLLKDLAGQGVEVVQLTPEQQKAFQAATRAVYDKWVKTIGPDLVKAAETSIANRN